MLQYVWQVDTKSPVSVQFIMRKLKLTIILLSTNNANISTLFLILFYRTCVFNVQSTLIRISFVLTDYFPYFLFTSAEFKWDIGWFLSGWRLDDCLGVATHLKSLGICLRKSHVSGDFSLSDRLLMNDGRRVDRVNYDFFLVDVGNTCHGFGAHLRFGGLICDWEILLKLGHIITWEAPVKLLSTLVIVA